MSTEASKGIWATIGKIAVVLGAILAALQIFKYFSTDGPIIRAQAGLYPFSVPVETMTSGELSQADLEKIIPSDTPNRESLVKNIYLGITIHQLSVGSRIARLTDSQMVVANISNSGNREAQDLKLSIRAGGLYELRRVGEPIKHGTFEQIISLGNLQPGNTISLTLWPRYFTEWQTDSVQVTHSSGVANVEFAIPVNGITAWPHRYWGLTLLLGVLVFVAAGIYGVNYAVEYVGGKRAPKVDQPAAPQTEAAPQTVDPKAPPTS